jgi:hypothetical protein
LQQLTGSSNHIIGYYHPISTKHKKTSQAINSSNNESTNRFKKKSNNNSKNNGTLSNQRGSVSSKQSTKLSCERLSDANFIANMNKKSKDLFINNLSNEQYQIQRLKSAASSPSLHGSTHNKQTLNLKKKDKHMGAMGNHQKQIFDFGLSS